MSTDGNGNGSVLDDGSSVASNQQNAIDGEIIKTKGSQTPRFTQEEKQILYSLFQEHEEVIDIKFRKKSRNKYSVRDAWEQIVNDFNSHPNVNAIRSCKQIQKFWLNSRLRKQYPFGNQKQHNAANRSRIPQTVVQQQQQAQQQQQQQQLISHAIKTEPEFQMGSSDTNDHNDQSESYEEIEMDGSTVTEDLDDDPLEAQQQHQQQEQAQQQQQQTQLQQVVPTSTIHVDQIPTNKITLTDLLQFKTNRPREEIILQIKHAGDATGSQITLPPPAPTRITIPPHPQAQPTMATITTNGYNQQIISEIKPQQITLAQYQAQQQLQQQQLAQQQQQQLVAQQAQLAVIQQDQQQQQRQAAAASAMAAAQQVKMQLQSTPIIGTSQFATATPTFTCTTFGALPAVAAASAAAATVPSNNMTVSNATAIPTVATITTTATLVNSSPLSNNNNVTTALQQQPQEPSLFMEKMNYFRLKEAELRVKEQQVTLERKKMELAYAEHQLKHLREVHRLQVEEFKVKIRIIQEEEIRLKKTMPSLPS